MDDSDREEINSVKVLWPRLWTAIESTLQHFGPYVCVSVFHMSELCKKR